MGLRFKDQYLGQCFFVTTSFYEHRRHGDSPGVYEELGSSLVFCLEKYGAMLPGFVFMPTHLHLLLLIDGRYLAGYMRDFKKFVAQKGTRACGLIETPIWETRYDRVLIHSDRQFRRKLEYIHRNPVRANLVTDESEWPWSSAQDYSGVEQSSVPVWTGWLS